MFLRKKKLFECDPKALDLDMLSHLQASLVARLILVNTELGGRWRNIPPWRSYSILLTVRAHTNTVLCQW